MTWLLLLAAAAGAIADARDYCTHAQCTKAHDRSERMSSVLTVDIDLGVGATVPMSSTDGCCNEARGVTSVLKLFRGF